LHFGLSEDQELLQETVRGFAEAEFPAQRLREVFDAGAGHDDAVWQGFAEMGIAGLAVPEAYGGAGLGVLELALVCEIAGGACLPGAILEHALASLAIARAGSEAQRERWLPKLAAGETVATVAFGEQHEKVGDVWRPEQWSLRESSGKLTGTKSWVPHLGRADLVVVGVEGGALAVLEQSGGSTPGARTETQEGIDRNRPIHRFVLDSVEAEVLPGSRDPDVAHGVIDAGLAGLAADAFGSATRLIRMCVDYTTERKQFGFPIAQFQAVKHQIARMGTAIEPTRALFWYAAHALEEGNGDGPRHAAMAKAEITDRALDIARDAVELHGGLGFTWECDVQMWFKRAMYDRSFLGTPEMQRERMAAMAGW